MISTQRIKEEYYKCFTDKSRIYMIEHFLSTFDATKGLNVAFELFPRQKAYLKNLATKNNNIAMKPRQTGITTISSAWIACECALADITAPITILLIANILEQTTLMLNKIIDFIDQVPRWFWGNDYYSVDPNSPRNAKSIYVKKNQKYVELVNGCKIYARAAGSNCGRGVSSPKIVFIDESAFIEEGLVTYGAAVMATSSVKDPKIIMVSTPNGKDELYYRTYRQALSRENNYTISEFRWYQDPRYNKNLKWFRKDKESGKMEWDIDERLDGEGRIEYNEERWAELERKGWKPTSPWYENQKQTLNNDPIRIAQELDVSFMGSSDNVVPPEYIEMQTEMNVTDPMEDMKDPLVEETWFWKPPIEGHRYICAVDNSAGDSEDNTAIEMIDIDGVDENGLPIIEQVMEYHGKKTGDDIGEMTYNYAKMYNDAFVVVEDIGGRGSASILVLMRMGYKNLYYDDPNLKSYTKEIQKLNYNNSDKLPGFKTSSQRFSMLRNFADMVIRNEFKIRSMRVINELDTWIFKGEDKRMDHMHGCHDDTITCLAMGLFVMKYSYLKIQVSKTKDTAILNAYCMANRRKSYNDPKRYLSTDGSSSTAPKIPLPFYTTSKGRGAEDDNYSWLFAQRSK